MTQVFPSAVITEFYNGSAWVNISSYVVSDIVGDGGFQGFDPSEFTASLGSSEFSLDNSGGLFTVYGGDSVRGLNTLSGWQRGAKIRHRVTYDGRNKVVWFGFVGEIISDDGTWGDQKVHVTCLDWIDVASRYPMKRSQILTDQTLADGVSSITDRVSVAPEGVDADPSSSMFPSIFDNVRSKTKALSEVDKLAKSEPAYVYVLKDGVLRVEAATTRKGGSSLSQVPVESGNALLASADNAILASTNNAILIDEIGEANLSLTFEKLDLRTGDLFWNDAYVRSYPTRTDTSLKVIFQIGSAIPIAGGTSIEFIGNYTDPSGGAAINATNLQTPTATTDYQMFANSDGTGTDLTANLTVSADYYGDTVVYSLTNTGTTFGWITKLQARGYGIYRTSYVENHISITGSATAYGEKTFDLNMIYQSYPYAGLALGSSVMELYKTPKTRIVNARYVANLDSSHMLSFMYLDIGSLIKVYDNRSGMYKWYHIASRKFTIFLGGIILVVFGLVEFLSVASGGLNPVAVEFAGGNATDAVNFKQVPQVSNLRKRTISAWIYMDTDVPDGTYYSIVGYGVGYLFSVKQNRKLQIYQIHDNQFGIWQTPSGSVSTGSWSHVLVTHDTQSDVTNDPIIYINGTPQTLTESSTPSGTVVDETGLEFVIGNVHATSDIYTEAFDGKIHDVRVYNRILTQAEVMAIRNGGVPSMSAGAQDMVFQAFAINSDLGSGSSLNGQQIPSGNNYFDNGLRRVGMPVGSPLIRPVP